MYKKSKEWEKIDGYGKGDEYTVRRRRRRRGGSGNAPHTRNLAIAATRLICVYFSDTNNECGFWKKKIMVMLG